MSIALEDAPEGCRWAQAVPREYDGERRVRLREIVGGKQKTVRTVADDRDHWPEIDAFVLGGVVEPSPCST